MSQPGVFNVPQLYILFFSLLLAGCRSPASKGQSTLHPPEPYVRVSTAESNLIQLQIAVRQFVPLHGHGPAIWLTGVSHIGDSNYYAALQRHLDAQTLVLFEGVSERARQPRENA